MNKFLMILVAGLLVSNLAVSVSADKNSERTFGDVWWPDHWYFDSVEDMVDAGLLEGVDDGTFFDASGSVDRAQLATVMDRLVDHNEAYNLSLAFLQWSINQETPQEITIDGYQILTSSYYNRADGAWSVFVAEDAVKDLRELISDENTGLELTACFANLYDYQDTELDKCEDFFGNIEVVNVVNEIEEY